MAGGFGRVPGTGERGARCGCPLVRVCVGAGAGVVCAGRGVVGVWRNNKGRGGGRVPLGEAIAICRLVADLRIRAIQWCCGRFNADSRESVCLKNG